MMTYSNPGGEDSEPYQNPPDDYDEEFLPPRRQFAHEHPTLFNDFHSQQNPYINHGPFPNQHANYPPHPSIPMHQDPGFTDVSLTADKKASNSSYHQRRQQQQQHFLHQQQPHVSVPQPNEEYLPTSFLFNSTSQWASTDFPMPTDTREFGSEITMMEQPIMQPPYEQRAPSIEDQLLEARQEIHELMSSLQKALREKQAQEDQMRDLEIKLERAEQEKRSQISTTIPQLHVIPPSPSVSAQPQLVESSSPTIPVAIESEDATTARELSISLSKQKLKNKRKIAELSQAIELRDGIIHEQKAQLDAYRRQAFLNNGNDLNAANLMPEQLGNERTLGLEQKVRELEYALQEAEGRREMVGRMQKRILELERRLENKNGSLSVQNAPSPSESSMQKLQKELSRTGDALAMERQKNGELLDHLRVLESEVVELRNYVAVNERSPPSITIATAPQSIKILDDGERHVMESRIVELESMLSTKLNENRNQERQLNERESEASELKISVSTMQFQLQEALNRRQNLESTVSSMREQMAVLEAQLEAELQVSASLRTQMTQLSSYEADQTAGMNMEFEQHHRELLEEMDFVKLELAEKANDCEELKVLLSEKERERHGLEDECSKLRADNERGRQKYVQLEERLMSERASRVQMEEQLQQQNGEDQIALLSLELESLQQNLSEKEQTIHNQRVRLESIQAEHLQIIAKLEARIGDQIVELDTLTDIQEKYLDLEREFKSMSTRASANQSKEDYIRQLESVVSESKEAWENATQIRVEQAVLLSKEESSRQLSELRAQINNLETQLRRAPQMDYAKQQELIILKEENNMLRRKLEAAELAVREVNRSLPKRERFAAMDYSSDDGEYGFDVESQDLFFEEPIIARNGRNRVRRTMENLKRRVEFESLRVGQYYLQHPTLRLGIMLYISFIHFALLYLILIT